MTARMRVVLVGRVGAVPLMMVLILRYSARSMLFTAEIGERDDRDAGFRLAGAVG